MTRRNPGPAARRPGIRAAAACILAGTFWFWGFPWPVDALAAVTCVALAVRLRPAALALTAASALAATLAAEIAWRQAIQTAASTEAPTRKHYRYGRYTPNLDVSESVPGGDLASVDPVRTRRLRIPRTIRFQTDERGFRNSIPLDDARLILVGDSFVVGNGSSQEDTLASVLSAEFGIPSYAIAVPAEPAFLLDLAATLLDGQPARPVFFFGFEGNDFEPIPNRPRPSNTVHPNTYDRIKGRVIRRFGLEVGLASFNLTRQIARRLRPTPLPPVETGRAGAFDIAFLGEYVDTTTATNLRSRAADAVRLPPGLRTVFLIPTKFRVYAELLAEAPNAIPAVPSPALRHLREQFSSVGIEVVDLTPTLQEESRRLLPEGRLTFWPDDTHWNGHGVRAAAERVARHFHGLDPSAASPPSSAPSDP